MKSDLLSRRDLDFLLFEWLGIDASVRTWLNRGIGGVFVFLGLRLAIASR